jgi:hypothetical protein
VVIPLVNLPSEDEEKPAPKKRKSKEPQDEPKP